MQQRRERIGILLNVGLGVILLATLSQAAFTVHASQECTGGFAPGVVLVGWRDTFLLPTAASVRPVANIAGGQITELQVPVGQECALVRRLRRQPDVLFAELDYALQPVGLSTPSDPGWSAQWGPQQINAPEAWRVTQGTPDVIIALLDTGVHPSHEDLANNLWLNVDEIPANGRDDDLNGKVDDLRGWHFYHERTWNGEEYLYLPTEDDRVNDDNGHGTHVAGIAGARIDNGLGIAGIAGRSKIMTVKVLDEYGNGWYSDLARGIVYAVDNGARIINLSTGGREPSTTLQAAVEYARSAGVAVIAAAGNDGGSVLYPAAYAGVVAVAATDQGDVRASFSNYGPQVDVAAPGTDIYSTWYRGNYFTKSGTSMAAPHVSGLAALIWSARPDLEAAQVTAIITQTASDANAGTLPGRDDYLGWGRIAADAALTAATAQGSLDLAVTPLPLSAGATALVTVARPLSLPVGTPLLWTAAGGTVTPTTALFEGEIATTTLHIGSAVGLLTLTATSGTFSGTRTLRVMPGPPLSATLTASQDTVRVGQNVSLLFQTTDRFGNLSLEDTDIHWTVSGGSVSPQDGMLYLGRAWAEFTAGPTPTTALLTATLEGGPVVTATLAVWQPKLYLPMVFGK